MTVNTVSGKSTESVRGRGAAAELPGFVVHKMLLWDTGLLCVYKLLKSPKQMKDW